MATANGELQYFVGREDELQELRNFVADPSPGVLLVTGPEGVGKSFLVHKFVEELKECAPAKNAPQDYLKATLKGQLPIALGKPIVVHHRLRRGQSVGEFGHMGAAIADQDHRIWGEHEPRNFRKSLRQLAEKLNPGGVLPVGPALAELLKGSPADIHDALYANDWPGYFVRVAVHACGAMLDDERLVVVIDAEKTFENEPVRHALSRIAGIVPKRAKLILCLREADPLLYDTEFLSYPTVKAPPNPPLAPVRLLPEDLAVESLAARLNLASDSELVKQVIARIGGLGILIPTVATLVNDAGLSLEEVLEALPAGCQPFEAMLLLASEALKVDAPVPDVLRLLAVAREPLSVPELQVALAILGDDLDTDSLTRAISVPVVRNLLSVEHDERPWRYSPYHDWVREAIRQVTLQQKDSLGEYHQALGAFYWARLQENEQDERAMRHCTHHLTRGGLDDIEAKQRYLTAVCQTGHFKRIWGLTREVEEELTLSRKLLEDDTLDIGAEVRVEICNHSGILAMDTGQLLTALWHFQQVRELVLELEKISEECAKDWLSVAIGNVGMVYERMGRLADSLDAYEEALAINREIGYQIGEAENLGNIANVYVRMGKLDAALEVFGEALDIQIKVRNVLGVSAILANIGVVNSQMGNLGGALVACRASLGIQRQMGYASGEATNLGNIALLHEQKGELHEALEGLRQALVIFEEIGAACEIEIVKHNIARVEEKLDGSES